MITGNRRFLMAIAGGCAGVAVSVGATQMASSPMQPYSKDCSELQMAMANAVNDKVRLIALTSPDPAEYFQVGGSSSCIGDFALTKIDFSRLIPDPFGLLSDAATGSLDQLTQAALGKACTVARNSIGDIIGRYNAAAVATIGGGVDVAYQIDPTIGDLARETANRNAINWQTNVTLKDPLAGIRPPVNAAATLAIPIQQQNSRQIQPTVPAPLTTGAAVFGQ